MIAFALDISAHLVPASLMGLLLLCSQWQHKKEKHIREKFTFHAQPIQSGSKVEGMGLLLHTKYS